MKMKSHGRVFGVAGAILLCWSVSAFAGQADVVEVKARKSGEGWHFDVTVAHQDTGWEHYADAWEVVGPHGTVYGTRELLHPHVDEQPFTRSLSGVVIPGGVTEVVIRARDSVHGFGGREFTLELPK
ncbi:hypothetical protein [Salaquimonas pukyongi]|uniref:hypothetical protein n=1 Tax=Salaquimonas pukyongi TaxID=2712698 RepID=UPI001BA8E5E6|nr:hypothetical protein [Salaquimonas pukyongi]